MPEEIVKRISGKKHIAAVYEVRGERIEVWFNPAASYSPLSAEYNENHYGAADIESLLEQLKRATKRKRVTVAIPFTDSQGRDGIITGRHTGNGNILVTWDNGRSEQLTHSYRRDYFKQLTPEQKAELKRLKHAVNEASSALSEFEKAYSISLREIAEDAIQGAVELAIAEEETPAETEV